MDIALVTGMGNVVIAATKDVDASSKKISHHTCIDIRIKEINTLNRLYLNKDEYIK